MRPVILLWIVAVVGLCLVPLRFKVWLGTTGPWHNWGHYFVFLLTSLLAAWNARQWKRQLLVGFLVVLFAAGTELIEVAVYRNSFEWRDTTIDLLGILTGLVLLQILSRRRFAP